MAQGYKTGGRKKGTPNKLTGMVRDMISDSVSKELQSLPYLLDQLEPREKIDAIIKLLPYLIPKIQHQPIEDQEKKETLQERIQRLQNRIQEKNTDKQQYLNSYTSGKRNGSLVIINSGANQT